MNRKPNRKFLDFLPLILTSLLLLGKIPTSVSQNDNLYQTCNQNFRCGRLGRIGYPFWSGNNRPVACGYPGFNLTCRENEDPLLNISSVIYRVLSIEPSTQTLTVSRNDLIGNLCSTPPVNSTLDFSLFDFYLQSNDQNITIYYGCNLPDPRPMFWPTNYQLSCNPSNEQNGDSLFAAGAQMFQQVSDLGITCNSNIFVPVNQTSSRDLENIAVASEERLRGSLEGGFSIRYLAQNQECSDCEGREGLCGYNETSTSFACLQRTGNGSKNTGLRTGLFIAGGVLAGIGFGFLVLFYSQRRKKQRVERLGTPSTQNESKKASAALTSNKSLYSPNSTTFTKSIPSYPSSKSDLTMASTYFGVQVFDYAELEQATDNFDTSKELGDGGFGTVYYGVLSDGRVVAVKRLYENNFKRVEQFMNEVEILTRLRHENLVILYGCTSKRSRELLLVYEYVPNGTVADHLNGKRAKSGLLSWPIRLNIAIETADALAYLHRSDIIHRDVKTNNILLDNDFHVKVADFGLSRLFPENVTHVSTAPQGTPGYVDPEYYQCYQLTEKSDVYSFGVVLVELLSSLPAVDTNRHRHDINLANMAVNKIQNHTLHELVDPTIGFETNSSVRRMITLVSELAFRCLQQERDMRPSMEEVLEALRGIQNEDMNAHKVEIVDLLVDDETGPLKDGVDLPSSESDATEQSLRGSAPGYSVSV